MEAQHFEITGQTGLVGVFGHPVGHSLSPRMHNAAFKAQGVDMVYLAFDVLPERLASAVEGLRSLGMRGVNITVPHKERVVELLDMIDPLAARIGAVNTVVNDRGRLCGYNTDVAGFLSALRSLLPGGAQGLRCLVAGAGGAARAIVAALSEEGAAEIWVHNRTFERAQALCEAASGWGRSVCEAVADEDLTARVRAADLLVNATSVGLGSFGQGVGSSCRYHRQSPGGDGRSLRTAPHGVGGCGQGEGSRGPRRQGDACDAGGQFVPPVDRP